MSPPRRRPPPLLALTPGKLRGGEDVELLARNVDEAWKRGLRGVLLREPRLSERTLIALAERLRASLPAEDGGWLGLHDRAHLAATVHADAIHVGFRSLSLGELRPWVPAHCALGVSAHAGDRREHWELADYLFFGPVFETPSKLGVVDAVGFAGLRAFSARVDCPVWALGGLRPEHAAEALRSGAAGVAALGSLLASADVASATEHWVTAVEGARA